MADLGRQGQDWNEVELDAIITDYFAMLGIELARRPYVKAEHRAALTRLTGGSIERKHQNISAVLMELGLPWVWGYKPLANYQEALYEALDRHLSTRPDLLYRQRDSAVKAFADPRAVFSDIPALPIVASVIGSCASSASSTLSKGISGTGSSVAPARSSWWISNENGWRRWHDRTWLVRCSGFPLNSVMVLASTYCLSTMKMPSAS